MINELEKMMLFTNQDSQCIFSSRAGLRFVQCEVINRRFPEFELINRNLDNELVMVLGSMNQLVFLSLEPVSKTTRVLHKYPRPPIVYDGALPYVAWHIYSYPEDPSVQEYWIFIGWGFCLFLIEMTGDAEDLQFNEKGYMKFGAEIKHMGLI
mmetsp:Transcript_6541/g.5871  ORF Transcript_6541/g.5871 Transcript_6541/m.5871 type:complete len:153 (+) Transcript_6541:34-492(+)